MERVVVHVKYHWEEGVGESILPASWGGKEGGTKMRPNRAENARQVVDIRHLVAGARDGYGAIQSVMTYLKENRPAYHWVGVYRLEGDMLVLGPYVGPETDHSLIPVGRGVCGTAVAENKNQIVGDVRGLSNYLACNLETRSEIVVLIRDPETQEILGQIDVDGKEVNGFDPEDEAFLNEVGKILAPYLGKN